MVISNVHSQAIALEFGWLTVKDLDNVLKTIADTAPSNGFAQAFNLLFIASEDQAIAAAQQAIHAVQNHSSFSKQLELEFLQRLVGEKQSNRALELAGIQEGKQAVGLIVVSVSPGDGKKRLNQLAKLLHFQKKPKLLDGCFAQNQKKIQLHFGVTEKQLLALKDLGSRKKALQAAVLEKVALVALEE